MLSLVTMQPSLPNGLGRTPPMGWNSWYDLTCADVMDANMIKLTADLMIIKGLAAVGYHYVNLDGCYLTPGAGGRVNGTLQPDPQHFGGTPGIKDLADYLHVHNLSFGVYTDRGSATCQGRAGSRHYEAVDAQTYASWGVDYVKEDSCNAYGDPRSAFYEYGLMRDALNATGRPIFFSACGWHEWYAPPAPALNYSGGDSLANAARIGPDDNNWAGVLANTDIMARVQQYARPGYWNDPCLLLSLDWTGKPRVSELQSRAQFALWCVMSAPLLISGSLTLMSAYTLATYSNARAIAINQAAVAGTRLAGPDIAACAGHPVAGPNCTNVWGKPLSPTSWALVLLNAGSDVVDVACDSKCLASVGIGATHLPLNATDAYTNTTQAVTGLSVVAPKLAAAGGFVLLVLNASTAP